MEFNLEKYREIFLEECDELFAQIDEILLNIDKKRDIDDKEIKDIFRHIHTIKGGAASVELLCSSKLSHEFETFLDKLRNKQISYKPEMADVFISSTDAIKELISKEIREEADKDDCDKKVSALSESLAQLCAEKKEEPEVVVAEKPKGYGFFEEAFEALRQEPPQQQASKPDNSGDIQSPAPSSPPLVLAEGLQEEAIALQKPPVVEGAFDKMLKSSENIKKDEPQEKQPQNPSMSIRVDLSKVDALLNNIGELVIDMSMLYQYAENIEDLGVKSALLEKMTIFNRHVRDFQESVMSMRMVPMENIYAKFPKNIRDISKKLGKQIEFRSFGNSVEIDKAMIEGLSDPLMHIIRNSCDHGVEFGEDRIKAGKPAVGLISIGAEQANGQIMISVRDDGKGIDYESVAKKALENGVITKERLAVMSTQEKTELIFEPGLSTAKNITEVSGRGVGMDVVKNNIQKLGGSVKIETKAGEGSCFTISLPLTLAILDGLNISVGDSKFILPLASIVESLQPTSSMIKKIGDGSEELLLLREEAIPIIRLHKTFNIKSLHEELTNGMLIVARSIFGKVALFVDMFLNQQQVVIKPIDKNFRAIKGVSGATVRGDGAIGLILDVSGIIELHKESRRSA